MLSNGVYTDCHVHITETGKWYNTQFDASVERLLREMDAAGIERSVLLPIYGATSNDFIKKTVTSYRGRFIGFGCTALKSWKDDLKQIKDHGLQGIKFHPRLQNETITDWDQAGILENMEKLDLPLLICGWQQTSAAHASMKALHPNLIDEVAKKYKKLKIVIAHFGGHKFLDAFFCARGNQNVFVDCSYFFHFFKNTSLERDALVLFKKLDEKIIFGSDFPEVGIAEYKRYFEQQAEQFEIDLTKLFSDNINKIVGHA